MRMRLHRGERCFAVQGQIAFGRLLLAVLGRIVVPQGFFFVMFVAAYIAFGGEAYGQSNAASPITSVNLARTAKVRVSGEFNSFVKAHAIDGDSSTEWASGGGSVWIALHWKTPQQVGRLLLRDRADVANKAQGGRVLFSDGSVVDVDGIPPGGAPHEVRFKPRTTTWLRFDLFSARGSNPGLAEIQVYSDSGRLPKPAPVNHPAPGTLVTIQDHDPRITTVDGVREGKWCGAMWCRFTGTRVKLFGATGPAYGMADVYIDGIWQKTVDWYSAEPAVGAVLFSADNLPDGKHLLGLLTRETKNPHSQGVAINWSRIEYVAGAHPERFTPIQRTRFDPNAPLWLDADGEPMQCHMGGLMFYQGRYYMVGSDWRGMKLPGFRFDWAKNLGMAVYSSADLMNWTYHGNFCGASDDPRNPLYDNTVGAVRGKLIRAAGTGKFVALFQVVDISFTKLNATAAAVADKPEGPYRWHGILQWDGKPVQGADTAVFTDDDGKQYLITGKHANDWNVADCLYQLSPDCLHVDKAKVLHTGGEAPAIFKYDGVYYLLHSYLTGLRVNDNFYHTATDIWGPWQAKGNIAQGPHSAETYMTQTTDVVPVVGKKGAFLWIGDSIRCDAPPTARTVWLPVTVKSRGKLEIRWRDSWDWSAFGN